MDNKEYPMEKLIDIYNMKNTDKYNYDVKETINNFSFEDLVKRNHIAAVIFFTDNQYVISYTENHGKGFHDVTLARI